MGGHDLQRWLVHLLSRYSDAYASNQFRALQQFFRWLAEEEQLPGPDGTAPCPQGDREAGAGVHQRRTIGPAARYARAARSPSGVTPRSSRCSTRPGSGPGSWPRSATTRTTPPQRPGPVAAGDHGPRQGRQTPGGPDRARGRPGSGPVPPRPCHAWAGAPAAAVAGGQQPGSDDRERDLPDDRPPRPAGRSGMPGRTGSGTISATPGWTAAAPRGT